MGMLLARPFSRSCAAWRPLSTRVQRLGAGPATKSKEPPAGQDHHWCCCRGLGALGTWGNAHPRTGSCLAAEGLAGGAYRYGRLKTGYLGTTMFLDDGREKLSSFPFPPWGGAGAEYRKYHLHEP